MSPTKRLKPSEIAVEAKKTYIPWIRHTFGAAWPPTSTLCHSEFMVHTPPLVKEVCRFAFYERDPVDLALDWAVGEEFPIPVIIATNDKRPGGDWEAGVMAPEECLCRRSNLFATLTTPAAGSSSTTHYPISPNSGIFSANVVVFRNGPLLYETWEEYRSLPVISVCPVKRPKLDSSGKKYSFMQEKALMREKITTALRIATWYGYKRLCIGTFGLDSGFRNPPEEVALMWRDALVKDPEFVGSFTDVVFAFESPEGPAISSQSFTKSSSSKSHKNKSSELNKKATSSDLEIFRYHFQPAIIHDAFKTTSTSDYMTET